MNRRSLFKRALAFGLGCITTRCGFKVGSGDLQSGLPGIDPSQHNGHWSAQRATYTPLTDEQIAAFDEMERKTVWDPPTKEGRAAFERAIKR